MKRGCNLQMLSLFITLHYLQSISIHVCLGLSQERNRWLVYEAEPNHGASITDSEISIQLKLVCVCVLEVLC